MGMLRVMAAASPPSARIHFAPDASPASSRTVDRKSTRLNSSHSQISYAVFCLKKKKNIVKSLPLIHDHVPVVRDICAQILHRIDHMREPAICIVKGLDRAIQLVELANSFLDMT